MCHYIYVQGGRWLLNLANFSEKNYEQYKHMYRIVVPKLSSSRVIMYLKSYIKVWVVCQSDWCQVSDYSTLNIVRGLIRHKLKIHQTTWKLASISHFRKSNNNNASDLCRINKYLCSKLWRFSTHSIESE